MSIPSELPFRVNPRTMQMLGRQNISSAITGLLELVKNAYDADATKVMLVFRNASKPDGFIVIEDDGEGMDFEALRDHWMVISTDNKLHSSRTKKGRTKVGEKGIGRLGMDRLATRSVLVTHETGEEGLVLTIDWSRYEQETGELQQIKHPLAVIPSAKETASGTTLYLTGLHDFWDSQDYDALYKDLSLLVPPIEQSRMDFSINIDIDEAPELSGEVISPMSSVAEYKLESSLSSTGDIHHILTHRTGEIIEDHRTWSEAFDDVAPGESQACGALKFILHFYLREASTLKGTGIKYAELIDYLDRFQGIKIYRDNFRVKPYGDPEGGPGADWLSLNARRVRNPGGIASGNWVIADNQVVGSVFISREDNPNLEDQTNREGLVENNAFRDMRKFILHGIQFLERERHTRYKREKEKENDDTSKKSVPVEQGLAESAEELSKLASDLRSEAEKRGPMFGDSEAFSERAEQVDSIVRQIEDIKHTHSEQQTQQQLMIGLSTLGIAMTAFGHETSRAITNVLGHAELLKGPIESLVEEVRTKAEKHLSALMDSAERVESWGQFALRRVSRDKRTRQNTEINLAVQSIVDAFQGPIERQHVEVVQELSSELPPLRAFLMDIEAIFINFMTNSLEAMRHTPLEDRKLKIVTRYDESREEFQICFCDSGKGIVPADEQKIFDPLFSTRVDKKGEPIGTGLGLTIVKNIVESYDGRIEVEGKGELGGAEFWVFLPNKFA